MQLFTNNWANAELYAIEEIKDRGKILGYISGKKEDAFASFPEANLREYETIQFLLFGMASGEVDYIVCGEEIYDAIEELGLPPFYPVSMER